MFLGQSNNYALGKWILTNIKTDISSFSEYNGSKVVEMQSSMVLDDIAVGDCDIYLSSTLIAHN